MSRIGNADVAPVRLIGIDPGLTGAIAAFRDGALTSIHDFPIVRERGKGRVDAAALGHLLRDLDPALAIVERVAARPGQGVTSMFNFGMGYGVILGALGALEIQTTLVTPVEWKRALRVSKDDGRAIASRLLPGGAHFWTRVRDDGRAEAALIGLWGVKIFDHALPGSVSKLWQAAIEW
jgi:crossover junction endodeoxyribonuclease RuvC